MGRWGHGNFDSDAALDVLGHWLNRIVAEINSTLEDDDELSMIYDEQGDAYVVGNVELLCVLSEQYGTRPQLDITDVERWRTQYLKAFDMREKLNEDDEKDDAKRKLVIQDTFERLKSLISNRQL